MGPATPMSSSWRRSDTIVRRRMKAPMVPMNVGNMGTGTKYGRDVQLVAARHDVVPELMRQEDGHEREREREPRGPGVQKPGIAGVTTREKHQWTGIGDPAGEDRTGERDRIQRGDKQDEVGHPALPPPGERPREDEMAAIRLVRPVVAAGRVGERRGECRRGPGMGRMYKRINDFPVREGGRPPRHQKLGQVHGPPLTRRRENPTIALSHPFELPDSIFNAFTSPPRGFARRRATEQRHTWISLN